MFDPHRTRYNDRRYFTKKGQIIQAKKVNPPFSIENDKINAYKSYIIRNKLIEAPIPDVDSFKFSDDGRWNNISDLDISDTETIIQGPCQAITIETSSTNPNFWILNLITCGNSDEVYAIPAGVHYKKFIGDSTVNDVWSFRSKGEIILEIAQVHFIRQQYGNPTLVQPNGISKKLINFVGLA